MEIYNEMIKNMAFCKQNRRVFRMDTHEISSPNKRYGKESSSKRSRSLPINITPTEEVKPKGENANMNIEINSHNVTFYGQGCLQNFSNNKCIKNPKVIAIPNSISQGGFLQKESQMEMNSNINHRGFHCNYLDFNKQSSVHKIKDNNDESEEFSDMNAFINKECKGSMKKSLMKIEQKCRDRAKRALKYKLLESIAKENRENTPLSNK